MTFLFNMREKHFLISKAQRFVNNHIHQVVKHSEELTWFDLDKNVNIYYDVATQNEFPDADFVVATAAPTTTIVSKLPETKGKKFYFIQNFETWFYDESVEKINETYNLGLTNIVISNELRQKVIEGSGKEPKYLPNFYNPDEFFLAKPIENRDNIVCLINHTHEVKRTKLGLEILAEVKKQVPDLKVELFGAYEPVTELADYVNFTYKANPEQLRNDIYGKSKIYLLPSVLEGWVLTGMEAMACGATVVSSRIGGIVDYANDGNSILIEPDNKAAFVKAIVDLLNDADKCETLAKKSA
ncbi:glycosyltransferase family 4 protein [Lactococcus fujiensis]|uniref:glycosyltransferase family 4 protein n=1 Tax=Lactococcus fujiensis TaxID=610251 RepID=UPI000AA1AD4C|nr:glycosyltransferase family 4 protein [Lactococcus fujiensis]